MLKKLSEKLGAKFPATTPSCSTCGKNWPPWWLFLKSFLTPSKPGRWPITAAKKKKTRIKRKGEKKNSKVEKPKAVGHFLKILISAHAWAKINVLNAILVARTASWRATNAFSTRLKLIWPRSSFKTTKMSKKETILAKSFRCQWVNKDFSPEKSHTWPYLKLQLSPLMY